MLAYYAEKTHETLTEKGGITYEKHVKRAWHDNVCLIADSRNNSPGLNQRMKYIVRHHNDLLKEMTDEQEEMFEKFDDCWGEYASCAEEDIFEYAFTWNSDGYRNT